MGAGAYRLMMSTTIGSGFAAVFATAAAKTFTDRSQALQRYFLEGRCWEDAAPTVKDHVAGSKRHEENLNRDLDITPPSMELG
jgi:hypothetical protein